MNKLLRVLLAGAFLVAFAACTNGPPMVEVNNQNTVKANVSLKPADGSTVAINNVEGGTMSPLTEIAEGVCRVTVSMTSGNSPADTAFTAEKNMEYSIIISSDSNPTLTIQY